MSTTEDMAEGLLTDDGPDEETLALRRMRTQRWAVLGAFGMLTLIIMSSLAIGPEIISREALSLEDDPTWNAERTVQEHLPQSTFGVFTLIAADEGTDGNVLDLEVLRELTARSDAVVTDPLIAPYLDERENPLISGRTTGPWSIAETVEAIMDGTAPITQVPPQEGGIPWDGPTWESATDADLQAMFDLLFAIEVPSPNGEGTIHPHRFGIAHLENRTDGWHGGGIFLPTIANRSRLAQDYAWEPGAELLYIEDWELAVDAHYIPDFDHTGEPVQTWVFAGLNTEIDNEVNATRPLVGAAVALMLVLVAIFFRDWRDVLAVAVGLGLLVAWLTGLRLWMGHPFTQLAAMLPILMLALGVDFAIHGLHRYRRLARDDPALGRAPRLAGLRAGYSSVRTLFPTLGLAVATTGIAFGTAAASPIPELHEWGLQAVLAIVSAYLLLGVFVVVLRAGWRPPRGHDDPDEPRGLRQLMRARIARTALTFERRGWIIIAGFVMLTVGTLWVGAPTSDFDARDYIDNDARVIRTMEANSRTFEETGEPNYFLIEGDDLTHPDALAALSTLVRTLEAEDVEGQNEVALIDLMRMQVARASAGGPGFVPTNVDARTNLSTRSAENLHIIEDLLANGTHNGIGGADITFSATPTDVRELVQLEDGRAVRMRLWFRVEGAENWDALRVLLEGLETWDDELQAASGVELVQVTGPSYTRYVYVNALTESFLNSILIAIALCAIVLLFALRRVLLALLTVAPVLAVTAWLQAGMVAADMSLNIVTVQVASLAIGLGIDYSIHVTQRLREARREHPGAGRVAWMRQVMGETGVALGASAATTSTGFLLLMASPMPLFSMFGAIMAIMIALSLMAAVIMLPPLLLKVGRLPFVEGLDSELDHGVGDGLARDVGDAVALVGSATGLRARGQVGALLDQRRTGTSAEQRTHLAAAAADLKGLAGERGDGLIAALPATRSAHPAVSVADEAQRGFTREATEARDRAELAQQPAPAAPVMDAAEAAAAQHRAEELLGEDLTFHPVVRDEDHTAHDT